MTIADRKEAPVLDYADLASRPSDGGHLTGEQARHIETYVRQLLEHLGLAQWQVWVSTNLPPEGALLMINPTDGRRCAMLHVDADWWEKQDADEKRTDLVHEVLHLTHHDVDAGIRHFLDGSGDVAEYVKGEVIRNFKLDLERMVDALSYVVAPHMPEWIYPAPKNQLATGLKQEAQS